MNMWTNYSQGMAAGAAGGCYDLSEHAVVSRLNGQADTALKPGMGVVQGDKPGSNVKIPATGATLEQFEGIVINDVNREMNMDGELLIQPKTTVGVMQYGRIWVRIADGVEPKYGDPVHLIINGTGVGCFKAAADGANTLELNARFIGAKDSSNIAPIMLYNQMHKTAAASASGSDQ